MKKLLIKAIEFYQVFISLILFRGVCKFSVSCSKYTKQMIVDFGAFEGSVKGIKRIWSCR